MNTTEREFLYRQKWTTIAFAALFFGVCAAVLFMVADDGGRRLVINGVLELSPQESVVALRVLGTLSLGFVALAGFSAFMRVKFRQRIVITDPGLVLPWSRWSSREVEVPYGDIVSCAVQNVGGQRFLKIDYGTGKFTITGSMLPGKGDLDAIRDAIAQRTNREELSPAER